SLTQLHGVPLGFDAEHAVAIELDMHNLHLADATAEALFANVAERAAHVPGVTSVAIAEGSPFGWAMGTALHVPGIADDSPALKRGANRQAVTNDYFDAMKTRIVAGRAFTPADDRADGPRVAIVSARLSKRIWGDENAVGRCLKVGADSTPCRTVV